eukprot:2157300-Alexandrium_andersonii.AAC.1
MRTCSLITQQCQVGRARPRCTTLALTGETSETLCTQAALAALSRRPRTSSPDARVTTEAGTGTRQPRPANSTVPEGVAHALSGVALQ